MPASFTDQLQHTVTISFPPKRIVSVVPSQTELLHALGLDEEVVGITKFCTRPYAWFRTKQRVGGTKTINIEAVKNLQPDLIIANKEENVKEQIEALQTLAPVWVSDIKTLADAMEMISLVGKLVDRREQADQIAADIRTGFSNIQKPKRNLRSAYLIWKDPYMAAGGDTFINDIMSSGGFDNVYHDYKRYPQITLEKLSLLDCELVLLSSEPYPFKEMHRNEIQKRLPNTMIVLADGEKFGWYGSRLLLTPGYIAALLKQVMQDDDRS